MVLFQKLRRTMTLHHSFKQARWGMKTPQTYVGCAQLCYKVKAKHVKEFDALVKFHEFQIIHGVYVLRCYFFFSHLGAIFAHRWFINRVFCILKID
jgi:hypothetical protein